MGSKFIPTTRVISVILTIHTAVVDGDVPRDTCQAEFGTGSKMLLEQA